MIGFTHQYDGEKSSRCHQTTTLDGGDREIFHEKSITDIKPYQLMEGRVKICLC